MPIYEYGCKTCGHRIEVLHGIHATGPTTCDVCGGPMTKLMSAPAIVFKGSGWAKKDARDRTAARTTSGDGDGKKPESGASEPSTAGAEASSTGSAESASGSARSEPAGPKSSGAGSGKGSSSKGGSGAGKSSTGTSGDR